MVEKLTVEVGLKVTGVDEAAKSFDQATKSIAALGSTGKEALEGAAAAAQKFGASANELARVETIIKSLEARAKDSSTSFSELAANYDKARASLVKVAPAAETVAISFATLVTKATTIVTAVVAAGVALSRYSSQAAKAAEALAPLAELSGKAMESVSAMQIAFAQGGVSVQKFASEFTALELKVQEAARTMAADVEASAQRISKAQQDVGRSTLSVEQAELALEELRLRNKGIDPSTNLRIQRQRKLLEVEAAEQRVVEAQQAQERATHQLRVAQANDLSKNIKLYQDMAAGAKVAFDPLTTGETKTKALAAALAKAKVEGADYTATLADIVKNASALERIEIKKALGLDDATLEKLKQGGDAIRAQQQAVSNLGIALTDVDQRNLKAFNDSWSRLGATADAALEKLGAKLAPLGTLIADVLLAALMDLIKFVQTTGREFEALGRIIDTVATAGAAAIDFMVSAVMKLITATEQAAKRFRELRAPGAPLPEPGGIPMAGGGLLGGRGTGTSDSNLAWVSRGEHIMPARAVRQPGVLAFLEALRRSGGNLSRVLDGMGRFALGGMIRGPMPAFAAGGLAGGMSNVTIQFPGLPAIGGLRASSDVVDQLHRAAALAQVRSGGRKPSRYS